MQVAQLALTQRASLRASASLTRSPRPQFSRVPFKANRSSLTCQAKKGKGASRKRNDTQQQPSIAQSSPSPLPVESEPVASDAETRRAPTATEPRPSSSVDEEPQQPSAATASPPSASTSTPSANGTTEQNPEPTPAEGRGRKDDILSEAEIQRLAELKRQQQRGLLPDSNIIQGALQEIELITWPTPKKALTDTVLVIAIVAATGVLLLGFNIVLSQTADWWYHTPHPDWLK